MSAPTKTVTPPPANPPAPRNPGSGHEYDGDGDGDDPTTPSTGATGFTPEPAGAHRPNPVRPAQVPARRRTAWLVAGCTLLAVAALQLIRLPEWIAYDQHGLVGNLTGVVALVGNLTGVVALVGIGIALIITGRERHR